MPECPIGLAPLCPQCSHPQSQALDLTTEGSHQASVQTKVERPGVRARASPSQYVPAGIQWGQDWQLGPPTPSQGLSLSPYLALCCFPGFHVL